jgi:hypothetical protein
VFREVRQKSLSKNFPSKNERQKPEESRKTFLRPKKLSGGIYTFPKNVFQFLEN